MSIPENPNRERELAELLAEVRALRREIDALKKDALVLPVATTTDSPVSPARLPPDYQVAVRGPFVTPENPARRTT